MAEITVPFPPGDGAAENDTTTVIVYRAWVGGPPLMRDGGMLFRSDTEAARTAAPAIRIGPLAGTFSL
jgi:hypothetical protein